MPHAEPRKKKSNGEQTQSRWKLFNMISYVSLFRNKARVCLPLVCLLATDLDHSILVMSSWKQTRPNACELVLGANKISRDAPILHAFADEMIQTSICLLRSWKTGFLLSASADMSIFSLTVSAFSPFGSPSNRASQMAWVATVAAATNSAS